MKLRSVGQDGILRRTGSPAGRVTNPPQAASLPHYARSKNYGGMLKVE
jgi:hypothetical protein